MALCEKTCIRQLDRRGTLAVLRPTRPEHGPAVQRAFQVLLFSSWSGSPTATTDGRGAGGVHGGVRYAS